jgi:hypothetical protein
MIEMEEISVDKPNPKPATSEERPRSLFQRVTDAVASTFDFLSPIKHPTFWHDPAHRPALVQIWDSTNPDPGMPQPRDPGEKRRLAETRKLMLEKFPELENGGEVLTDAWMEHVLGKCFRGPASPQTDFTEGDKMRIAVSILLGQMPSQGMR